MTKIIYSKKLLSIIFFVLMSFFLFILVKTELRKWFIFEGNPSSANTLLFWISLALSSLFGFLGLKLWSSKNTTLGNKGVEKNNKSKEEGEEKIKIKNKKIIYLKNIYFTFVGLSILVLIILAILTLLGYKFNKQFFSYSRQDCINQEYPTYYHHSGIAGCIFWMRQDYLKKEQSWESTFVKDEEYCKLQYNNSEEDDLNSYANLFQGEYSDPKCTYSAYEKIKRNENWGYLVSKEEDGIYDYCVNQSCPKQPLFK